MRRLIPFAALFSIVVAGYAPTTCRTQSPLVPPGPVQPIIPPAPIVVPTPAPPLVPTPDDGLGLEIIAKVNGVLAPEPVVSAPPRSLVVLTLTGGAMTETTAVTWSLNAPTVSLDLTQEGRHVAYSPFGDAPMLFTASINGETSPYVAQRWIVAGGNPGPAPPGPGPQPPDTPPKVTAVTYVYEKDETPVPAPVQAALNRLNRERGITATLFEDDTTDGRNEVPEQYKTALAAAKESGLPSLVVQAGDKVISVVNAPTTEAQVLEAVK